MASLNCYVILTCRLKLWKLRKHGLSYQFLVGVGIFKWEFSITNSSRKSRAKEHTWFARSRRFWLIRTCWRWRSVEAVRTNPSSSNGPSLSLVEIFLYLSKLPNNKSHNSSENVALKAFWAFDHSEMVTILLRNRGQYGKEMVTILLNNISIFASCFFTGSYTLRIIAAMLL